MSSTTEILGLMGTLRRIVGELELSTHHQSLILSIIQNVEYQVLVPTLQKEAKLSLKDLKDRLAELIQAMNAPPPSAPPSPVHETVPETVMMEPSTLPPQPVKRKQPQGEKKKRSKKSKKSDQQEGGEVQVIQEGQAAPALSNPPTTADELDQFLRSICPQL